MIRGAMRMEEMLLFRPWSGLIVPGVVTRGAQVGPIRMAESALQRHAIGSLPWAASIGRQRFFVKHDGTCGKTAILDQTKGYRRPV